MSSSSQDQPKLEIVATGTPQKGKRMANVLKVVLRPAKMASPVAPKITESPLGAPVTENVITELKVATSAEASLDADKASSSEACLITDATSEKEQEKIESSKVEGLTEEKAPLASKEVLSATHKYIIHHASGGKLNNEKIVEVHSYTKDLKYPSGSLIYGGNDEDDYLYCLLDNREIEVCREMMDKMGYPKLELGLSTMSKD
jgi:hypothetical protein